MKKWEYKTIAFSDDYPEADLPDKDDDPDEDDGGPSWEDELNDQGRQGWELVSVIHPDPEERQVVAVLKREIGRP